MFIGKINGNMSVTFRPQCSDRRIEMKTIFKYLALPLLLISLAACGGTTDDGSSEPIEIQTDWTDEEKELMHSILGMNNVIPFHELFVTSADEYSIEEYYSVGKVSVELLLPKIQLDSSGKVFYDPFDDLEIYKDFCLENDYMLNDEHSIIEEHDYTLYKTISSGMQNVNIDIVLEIYLTSSGYLIVNGFNETTYSTTFWPSRANLNTAKYGSNFFSVNELLGLNEEQIPALVSNNESIAMEVSYLFKMYRGDLSIEMKIITTDNEILNSYAADLLLSARYTLDSDNSTIQYDDYYSATDEIDIFLFDEHVDNTFKILFVVY